ncbi:hypothetical protein BJ741DRAFT_425536 [Chytriomyces cf. hyalinus JEL632]|nr:hypothetical protein BJ741DRAFT_38925 [Chytriomyces cf. hyalinus JEL632]KAI8828336.1 hypothetical protein BJ741DRAFT_425536 [Chytriomyces cf. hyalinus JEL632]
MKFTVKKKKTWNKSSDTKMPLTKEQKGRVRHEVDHAGLVNQVSCTDRITALSTELQCDIETIKIFINNYRQARRKAAGDVRAVPAAGPEPTCDQQPEKNLSSPADLQELNDILVQRPRKVRIVASEKMPGYQMFLRKLGRDLNDANKALKKDNSQAELLRMNKFQMVTSESGVQLGSKWAALSQDERDEYERMARDQIYASKENMDSTGGSISEIREAQRKAYLTMATAIRNFDWWNSCWHFKIAIRIR